VSRLGERTCPRERKKAAPRLGVRRLVIGRCPGRGVGGGSGRRPVGRHPRAAPRRASARASGGGTAHVLAHRQRQWRRPAVTAVLSADRSASHRSHTLALTHNGLAQVSLSGTARPERHAALLVGRESRSHQLFFSSPARSASSETADRQHGHDFVGRLCARVRALLQHPRRGLRLR
jgi:hypothetical protein